MDHAAQRVSPRTRARPTVLDAATPPSLRRAAVTGHARATLDSSRAAVAMAPDEARDPGVDFDALVAVCLEVCVSVQRLDTLFGPVYAMLRPSALARRAFLLGLEPYLLRHRLPYLPATVLLDLTQLYAVMAAGAEPIKQSCGCAPWRRWWRRDGERRRCARDGWQCARWKPTHRRTT